MSDKLVMTNEIAIEAIKCGFVFDKPGQICCMPEHVAEFVQSQNDEITKIKQDRDHADDEVAQKNVEIERLKAERDIFEKSYQITGKALKEIENQRYTINGKKNVKLECSFIAEDAIKEIEKDQS